MPGCGKGYDVALFAAYGYDAYGLEVSSHAAEAARKYLADPGKGPLEGEYAIKDENIGRGTTEVVCGDFFDDGWLKDVNGWDGDEGFDIIYDNTVSADCSIPTAFFDGSDTMHSSCVLSRPPSVPSGRHV